MCVILFIRRFYCLYALNSFLKVETEYFIYGITPAVICNMFILVVSVSLDLRRFYFLTIENF